MSRSTLEWYEMLARGLVWAAGIVLLLSLVGAVVIAGSDNALPVLEDVERQGRGVAALASLGGGITAAGLLGGVGAVLRLLVTDRLEKLGPAPDAAVERPARSERAASVEEESPPEGDRGPVERGADRPAKAKPKGRSRGRSGDSKREST